MVKTEWDYRYDFGESSIHEANDSNALIVEGFGAKVNVKEEPNVEIDQGEFENGPSMEIGHHDDNEETTDGI